MENELRLTEKELLDKCRLFENTNGEIVITSLQMSKDFGIPHFKIMDNCRKWLDKGTNTLQVLVYKDGKGEEFKFYRSTGKELTKELQYYVVNYSNYCNKGEF